MAVVNVDDLKIMGSAIVQYKLQDLLVPKVEELEANNKIVADEYYEQWLNMFSPVELRAGERIREIDYKSPYSYYTLVPFANLLMANIVNTTEQGVILSLHYSTGEMTMLPLADWEEAVFIYHCLLKAEKPIFKVQPNMIRFQDIRYEQ